MQGERDRRADRARPAGCPECGAEPLIPHGIYERRDLVADQIASLVDSVRDEGFSVTFRTSGTPRPVSAAVALALHRTTLEALTNVRKHAAAANVELELAGLERGQVRLRVRDDGKGSTDGTMGTGFGLTGIRERAEQLRGTANYQTAPSQGFTLSVQLPA